MAVYRLKNWSRYQHYRHRSPPWIKLHYDMLSSKDWVTLDDASRVLAVACMLIASRNDGEIPDHGDDGEYLKRVAYLNKKPNFKPLIDCGFLESASAPLADASALHRNADSEKETETETEALASAGDKRTNGHAKPKPLRRCPEDFAIPDPERKTITGELPSDFDIERETAKFRDWEFRTPRSDWLGAWRNWMRKARDEGRYAKRSQAGGWQ